MRVPCQFHVSDMSVPGLFRGATDIAQLSIPLKGMAVRVSEPLSPWFASWRD